MLCFDWRPFDKVCVFVARTPIFLHFFAGIWRNKISFYLFLWSNIFFINLIGNINLFFLNLRNILNFAWGLLLISLSPMLRIVKTNFVFYGIKENAFVTWNNLRINDFSSFYIVSEIYIKLYLFYRMVIFWLKKNQNLFIYKLIFLSFYVTQSSLQNDLRTLKFNNLLSIINTYIK